MSQPNDIAASVLITGASTGIGEACALELDRRGFRVFAGVRRECDGQRLQEQASSRLTPLSIDVTESETIRQAAEVIGNSVGKAGLAGLVNNAGIAVSGPLEIVPIDILRKQLEVNVIGQVAVTQAMLPLLRQAQGRIVNIGSISGRIAIPFLGPYAASKFALEALTDSLRLEVRRWGIAVSIIEPGSVKTPIWEKSKSAAEERSEQMPPELMELYEEGIDKLRAVADREARSAMPVDRVVRAVLHALTAKRPKTRYPVGRQTKILVFALRWMSDRMRDWLICRDLGL